MTIAELMRYLPYAPNTKDDFVLLDRKTYERLLYKAKTLDAIKNDLNQFYKTLKRYKNLN